MLNKPTYAIVTVVTMGTLWLLGENGCYGRWSIGLVVKALDSQSRGPVFKTTGWLQGRLSLSSLRGR